MADELLKQLAEAQCRNVVLEDACADAREEAAQSKHHLAVLERSLDTARDEICQLRAQLLEKEAQLQDLNDNASKIASLQQSNKESQRRVAQLEAEVGRVKEEQARGSNQMSSAQLQALTKRLGLSPTLGSDEVYSEINDRLDKAALNEARCNHKEFATQEVKDQLRESQKSANELANRVEVLLNEKEVLKRESSILSAEHAEFEAKRGLLDQRIKAQERQIAELKQQLVSETDRANQAKLDSQQIVFEKNSQTVQLTALIDSLAASLSTLDQPCPSTESGVKEAVSKLTSELRVLRNAGVEFEKKVENLQRQFEFQFTNGQALTKELKTVREQLKEESTVAQRAHGELEGFRLMNSQKQFSPPMVADLLRMSECLGVSINQSINFSPYDLFKGVYDRVMDLVERGCIPQDCLQGAPRPSRQTRPSSSPKRLQNHKHQHHHQSSSGHGHEHVIDDGCPSCELMQTSALDLARCAPEWRSPEESRVQNLCLDCCRCLVFALRHRLREGQDKLPSTNQLADQLAAAKREIEELHTSINKAESAKTAEYEKLEQMVTKLEALRQHQAKRIAGLQSKTQAQRASDAQKDQQLNAAKSVLIDNRQKQMRLMDFRNSICRLVGVDAWLAPNPEAVVIQRVQQLLLQAAADRRFYPAPSGSTTWGMPTAATSSILPALPAPSSANYSPLRVSATSTDAVRSPIRSITSGNLQQHVTSVSKVGRQVGTTRPPTSTYRSKSARGRDSQRY